MLKIHHIRNASMIIEVDNLVLLVDPLLAKKGEMPSYTEKSFNPQRNPIVDLPQNTPNLLQKVTDCIITHLHSDHLDVTAKEFLIKNKIPTFCSINDEKVLAAKGLNIYKTIEYWKNSALNGFSIEGIPATHGYGKVAKLMGNVMGFFIKFRSKSIYLSSDTIYTPEVEKVLKAYKPDIAVVACGTARLDEHGPILMTLNDIIKFVNSSPEEVIANHMEAVNHCTTTRAMLKKELINRNSLTKVWIPEDGETKIYED